MNFAFRVDASPQIGLGHVMRCLALADAAKSQGAACHFLSAVMPNHMAHRLRDSSHSFTQLPANLAPKAPEDPQLTHSNWITGSQKQDANACLSALKDQRVDWVVLDHYGLNHIWQKEIRAIGANMAVLDDIADRIFDTDLLVDPNPVRAQNNPYVSLVPQGADLCLGGDFAILRPEFAEMRGQSISNQSQSSSRKLKLLVMFGGTDPQNATGRVLQALKSLPEVLARITSVDIVMGKGSEHLDRVASSAEALPVQTHLDIDLRDVANLMSRCDLCIGAAGSAAWERCCLGLPSLLFKLADNQAEILNYLEQVGAGIALPDLDPKSLDAAFATVDDMKLQRMSQTALGLVDGLGSGRIIARMMQDQAP